MQQTGGSGADSPGVDGVQFAVQRGNGVTVVFFVSYLQFAFELAKLAVTVNNILKSWHI
ncbi:hypothetical protein D3C79_1022430 [compost metagenome]